MSTQRDVLVIGAGIVGLATARALVRARPGLRVAVLDKETRIGAHQTGHNSGVVHSGVYYRPGSLKAVLCTEGKAALERICRRARDPVERRGKLIVALDENELPRLEELQRRAEANGVAGLRILAAGEIGEIEPNAIGSRALHVPGTGVIDYAPSRRRWRTSSALRVGEVLLGHPVSGIEPSSRHVRLSARAARSRRDTSIACAGLQSDRLARASGATARVRIVPFRGDYYTLRRERRVGPRAGVPRTRSDVPVPRRPLHEAHRRRV